MQDGLESHKANKPDADRVIKREEFGNRQKYGLFGDNL